MKRRLMSLNKPDPATRRRVRTQSDSRGDNKSNGGQQPIHNHIHQGGTITNLRR